jgi:uncharacterized membrane protein
MNDPKPHLQSATIKGAYAVVIAIVLSKVLGIKIPSETVTELSSIIGTIPADWAMLVTALAGAAARVVKWDFDKTRLKSKTFYLGLLTALFGIMNVLGMDTAGFEDVSTAVQSLIAKYAPVAASLYMLFGAAKAKKAIAV